jgi:hypothetical protein
MPRIDVPDHAPDQVGFVLGDDLRELSFVEGIEDLKQGLALALREIVIDAGVLREVVAAVGLRCPPVAASMPVSLRVVRTDLMTNDHGGSGPVNLRAAV